MTGLSRLRLNYVGKKQMRNTKGGKNMANPTYEVHANDAAREASVAQFNIDRTYSGQWTITFSNPPINMFVPSTIVELGALMTDLESDPSVKVVVFQSANPDFFVAHLDVAKAAERPEVLGLWREFVLRLSSTPVVSIAKIRGRTRGIGNEFVPPLGPRHCKYL